MKPLTFDDLIPLDEYVANCREYMLAAGRYLERYRRVRVGPKLTLIFENRQTLWFRFHEILRAARLSDPRLVQSELDRLNSLLPGAGRLHAALHLDLPDGAGWKEQVEYWQTLPDSALVLRTAGGDCTAEFITNRPEDRAFGIDHWVEFAPDAAVRSALADRRSSAFLAVEHRDYRLAPELADTVRRSLLDDLSLSERSAA